MVSAIAGPHCGIPMRAALVAAVAGVAVGQSPAPQTVFERELAGDRAEQIEYVTQHAGGVFVWVDGLELDTRLAIRCGDGTELADDDSGGAGWPFARRACAAGLALSITVESQDGARAGRVRVVVQEMPDSPESRAASAACLEALREAETVADGGDFAAAARLLREAAFGLLQVPNVATDADAHGSLWRATIQLDAWNATAEALAITEALLPMVEAHYPPHCRAVVQQLNARCGFLMALDRGEEALPWCERAVATSQRAFGADHEAAIVTRFNHGLALESAGKPERAKELLLSAVSDFARISPADDERAAGMLGQCATVLETLGEFEEARRVQERALEVLRRVTEPTDGVRMTIEGNLAGTLSSLGDVRSALAIHVDMAQRYASLVGVEHALTRLSRQNAAVCRLKLGEAAEALPEFEALAAAYRATGEEVSTHAEYCDAGLANALLRTARPAESLRVAERREALRAAAGRADFLGRWRFAAIAAEALEALGRNESALQRASEALACARVAFAPENPDLAEVRQLTARLELSCGSPERAFQLAAEAAEDALGYLSRVAQTLSMRQAEVVQAHWSRLVSDGISLLHATAPAGARERADALAFELTEAARGIGTAVLRFSAATSTPEVEELRRAVRERAHEIARIGAAAEDAARVAEVVEHKESAERALRAAIARTVGESWTRLRPSAASVAASLAADECALAFWRCDARALEHSPPAERTPRMLAFVLRKDSGPRCVDLGPLAPIAALVERWRAAASGGRGEAAAEERAAGDALRTALVDPLRKLARDARLWRVAADDILHMVALDALPDGAQRLGDSLEIALTPAFALPRRAPLPNDAPPVLLALGGIDYDFESEGARSDTPVASNAIALALRGGPWESGFAELWETEREVAEVARLFGAARSGGRSILLTERDATKRGLLAAAGSARYVHVATHGFFALEQPNQAQRELALRSPLALCGLALSGANAGPSAQGFEGVITAEELATLDLSRCELAVLSACDTAVGLSSAGQGVASFQKALHAAGARTVVTSLWKVADEPTRALMSSFYTALWREGLAPERALQRAKREMRERRAPARDWAGWVLSRQ